MTCPRRPAPHAPAGRAASVALAVAAGLMVLAACGGETAPDVPSSSAPGVLPTVLAMDADGVGPLGTETPFDTASVRTVLPPGFAFELRSVETEGGLVPVVWALRDGLLVLEVFPDEDGATVARVDAASDQVEGPGGVRTGQTFADLDGADMDCEPGEKDLSGRIVCRTSRGGAVRYVFAHADADAGRLPDDDRLADAILERLVWTAD